MSSTTAVDNESSPLAPVVMIGHLHLPAEVEVAGNTTTTTTTSTTAINANITTTTDGSSQDDGIGQEVVSEMVAFNAADVTEVEAFDEVDWTQQQQQQQQHHLHHHHHHHQGHHNGHSDYAEEVSAGGGGDGGGGMLSSHERDQRLQHHQDHIVDGAMIMSSGGQVMFVESGEVSTKMAGRVSFTRPAAPVVDPPSEELVEEKVFATKSAYVPHQRLEHSNVSIPTSSQPAATSAAEAPRRIHLCTLCNKVFTTSSNLQQHRRLHLNERPFKCDQCNKGFATSTNLKQHYRTHTGDRPYPCVYCSKRFATNSNLRQHIRTHTAEIIASTAMNSTQTGNNSDGQSESWEVDAGTGVSLSLIPAICLQQYVCNICSKVYSNSSNLAQHKRTIHPIDFVRRYLCTFCKKTFSLITNLRRHQKRTCPSVKHEPIKEPLERRSWRCDECGKVCSAKGNLKSHKATHLGLKMFECLICEKRFTTHSNLKQHLMIHDGKYNGLQRKRKRISSGMFTEERQIRELDSAQEASPGSVNSALGSASETTAAVRELQDEVGTESLERASSVVLADSTSQDHEEEHIILVESENVDVASLATASKSTKGSTVNQYVMRDTLEDVGGGSGGDGSGRAPGTAHGIVSIETTPPASLAASSNTSRMTKRPVIIKLDVDRDSKPIVGTSNFTDTCGVTVRSSAGESFRQQPVLLPPILTKSPTAAGSMVVSNRGRRRGPLGAKTQIRAVATRR